MIDRSKFADFIRGEGYEMVTFNEEPISDKLSRLELIYKKFEEDEDAPQNDFDSDLFAEVMNMSSFDDAELFPPEEASALSQSAPSFDFSDFEAISDQSPEAKVPPAINLIWEGSQFVWHSLALINREHCLNIIKSGGAELTIIPYEQDQFTPEGRLTPLKDYDIRYKADAPEDVSRLPYVWIRHQWPPKADPPSGAKWIIMQPWEFTEHRKDFLEIFNNAVEIWTPSNYSRNSFINSGVNPDKVQIVPNGVNPETFKPYGEKFELDTEKKLKFLFVGGTIYRKGIDILLEAYSEAFTAEDDVALIIKDMGGDSFYMGQTAKEAIKKLQAKPGTPEIIYVDEYLAEEEMAALYRTCDVFVSPYRGEGFSLPALEAMACGLPLVVTEGGSTEDFVPDAFAQKISAKKISIGTKLGESELAGEAFMLEPDRDELRQTLIDLYKNPQEIKQTGLMASEYARSMWTWRRATIKALSRIDYHCGTQLAIQAENELPMFEDDAITLSRAERLYQKDDYEGAEPLFYDVSSSATLYPEQIAFAFNRLGVIALSRGENLQAEELFGKAELLAPDSIDCKYYRSIWLNSNGQTIEALEEISAALDAWHDKKFFSYAALKLEDLLLLTGDLLYISEDPQAALQVYTAALKINNESAFACYGAALCLEALDSPEKAREMLEWAVKINPGFEQAKKKLEEMNAAD
ncbi:MAG: glycosyltransferase [Chloroflexota bacterium]